MGKNSTTTIEDASKNRAAALKSLQESPFYEHLSSLKNRIQGEVVTPVNEGNLYMTTRERPYNQDFRGDPLLIIKAKNTADVVEVVNFVREYCKGLKFCISCGAHSNRCMLTDSIVLDLQLINFAEVNPEKLTIDVGGGAYLVNADSAMAPHNFATTFGTCNTC